MIDGGVTGLILAGGRGSRMGDVDKGLQCLDGLPLVEHAIRRLRPQVDKIIVNANRQLDRHAAFGYAVVADGIAGHAGPLAGIDAGLGACTTAHLLVLPCDAPYFPMDLVERLGDALVTPGADLAYAATAVRTHPVFCLMRTSVRGALLRYLADGGRSVHGWVEAMSGRRVSFDDEDAFRNINTLDELRAAGRPAPAPGGRLT